MEITEKELDNCTRYRCIDVPALVQELAEIRFKDLTYGVPDKDLYRVDIVDNEDGKIVVRELRSTFANLYWDSYRAIMEVVVIHTKR